MRHEQHLEARQNGVHPQGRDRVVRVSDKNGGFVRQTGTRFWRALRCGSWRISVSPELKNIILDNAGRQTSYYKRISI